MIGNLMKSLNLRRGAEGRAAGVDEEVWIGGADGSGEGNRGGGGRLMKRRGFGEGTVEASRGEGGLGPPPTPRGCADTKRWGSGEPAEDGGGRPLHFRRLKRGAREGDPR